MAYFEVIVQASVQMLVEADSEKEAQKLAYDDVDFGCAGHKEIQKVRLLKSDAEIEQMRRLADQTSED